MTDEPIEPTDDDDFDFEDFGEDQQALIHVAKMGLTVFRAVIRDGGSWNEAFSITAAFFAGMSKGMAEDN